MWTRLEFMRRVERLWHRVRWITSYRRDKVAQMLGITCRRCAMNVTVRKLQQRMGGGVGGAGPPSEAVVPSPYAGIDLKTRISSGPKSRGRPIQRWSNFKWSEERGAVDPRHNRCPNYAPSCPKTALDTRMIMHHLGPRHRGNRWLERLMRLHLRLAEAGTV